MHTSQVVAPSVRGAQRFNFLEWRSIFQPPLLHSPLSNPLPAPKPNRPCSRAHSSQRQFNFVEYPPESKKLPSAKEIVKSMEEREAKRRAAAARAGVDAHLAAAGALKRVRGE